MAINPAVATETGARVTQVIVDRGASVTNGQVLLRLDSRIARASLERGRVELREAERDLVRWQEMKRSGAVAESEFDRIKQRRDLAAIAIDAADAALSKFVVRCGGFCNRGSQCSIHIRLERGSLTEIVGLGIDHLHQIGGSCIPKAGGQRR